MQKLHLVGFTAEFDGLIFSTRKGARSGSFVVPLDARLLKQIADAERHRDGGDSRLASSLERVSGSVARAERPLSSSLTPREMQDRLRSGWTLDEVAQEAGVDADWVARFAAPVLAEVRRVVEQAQAAVFDKPRVGESALPLGPSVRRNVADKGIALTDDEADASWSAYQAGDDLWVVRFSYRSRGRAQEAEWVYDVADDYLVSRNRLGSQLGHVTRAKSRTRPPAVAATPRPPAVKKRAATQILAAAAAAGAGSRRSSSTSAPSPSGSSSSPSNGSSSSGGASSARRSSPSKASVRRAAAARKAPATKASTRKAAATKAPAKKAPARKGPARKGPARKGPARKAPARKPPAKKAPGRKATPARKVPAKKVSSARKAAPPRAAEHRADGAAATRRRQAPPARTTAPAPSLIEAPLAPDPAAPAQQPVVANATSPGPRPAAAPAPAPTPSPAGANDTGPVRRLVFDDVADGGPDVAPWVTESRGPLPPPPPAPVPDEVREAAATPIIDADVAPPQPGAVAIDEETGIARIDSRRTTHYVSAPPARSPVFRPDVERAGTGAPPPAAPPAAGAARRRRSEPLRGR